MFVSISRRSDIPALYANWVVNRFKAGFVYVRNPMNYHSVSKVSLKPETINGIVFWTKNAINFLPFLSFFDTYPYYFQYSITPYDASIETNLPDKKLLIENFICLSNHTGKNRMIWRYDPIFISDEISVNFHTDNFERLCERLAPHARKCVISFLDLYKKNAAAIAANRIRALSQDEMLTIAQNFSNIARRYNLAIETCAETIDLNGLDIRHGKCIDDEIFSSVTGLTYHVKKDKNQRNACLCAESIDIGQYDTCTNGCIYCYANSRAHAAQTNKSRHDPDSGFLCGSVEPGDVITERSTCSFKRCNELFDQ